MHRCRHSAFSGPRYPRVLAFKLFASLRDAGPFIAGQWSAAVRFDGSMIGIQLEVGKGLHGCHGVQIQSS